MRNTGMAATCFTAALLMAAPAAGQDRDTTASRSADTTSWHRDATMRQRDTTPSNRIGMDSRTESGDSWISISGVVDSVASNSFTLDYGTGSIRVEMDERALDADTYRAMRGDTVTVHSVINDDFFESRRIEASRVYVSRLSTWFYSDSLDRENTFVTSWSPVDVSETVVQGVVTEVNSEEFVVDTGTRAIRIEVTELASDPLNGASGQNIEVGDRVAVAGSIDDGFLERRALVARTVVVLGG